MSSSISSLTSSIAFTAIKVDTTISNTPNNLTTEKSSPSKVHPIITDKTSSIDATTPAIDSSTPFNIPLEYTIKESEARDYYKNSTDEDIDYKNTDNVKYEYEFNFDDGTTADVYKVVRDGEKVKLYYNAESFEKAMLVGVALNGYYDFNKDDYEHYNKVNKVIYKDLEKDNGYVIEFNKVAKNKPFIIESDKLLLEHSHDFKVCDEIKLK